MIFPMKIAFLASLLLSGTCVVAQGQYDYGRGVNCLIREEQHSAGIQQSPIVEGLPLVNGSLPIRREIRELEESYPEQWTLYILALNYMQYTDQSDPFSYYQLSGIHGAPFADYNGVKALSGHSRYGYCTHVSNIFPTWHRPYLVLYEQVVYNIAQWIASMYPEGSQRNTYQKAAQDIRIPYWDFAALPSSGSSLLPFSVSGSPKIWVDGPNGNQSISNPLYSYSFNPLNATAFHDFPFNLWNETKRAPLPNNASGAVSNDTKVSQDYDNLLPSIQQRLYNLFSNYDNYSLWSNEAWIPYGTSNSSYDSIESLHDTIHLTGGGWYGHLAVIPYSSQDPLFWLLHGMVDRVFAMWQVVYNDSYVEPMSALLSTRTINAGDVIDAKSDLKPFFFDEQDHFWNSDMVRDHTVFGYTYEDVVGGNRDDVIAAINRLYTNWSPATLGSSRKRSGACSREGECADAHDDSGSKDIAWYGQTSSIPALEQIVKDGCYQEWVANIHVNKWALEGSFSVLLFLGNPPEDESSWTIAENLVGTLGIFANTGSRPSRHIGGTIPLTKSMMESVAQGHVRSLMPEEAEGFLKQKLQFRIVLNQDGSDMDPAQVDGLHISIVSSEVTAPKSNHELASWGKVNSRFELYP